MKILDIKLKNLNSLRGEWHINLADKVYSNDGIFAVTGPTGSGKTTIFDAVCLAIYAQTPRLGKIGGKSNEIMSKKTNECYAAVLFENNGKIYKAEWKQHRAGNSNKLQTPKHILWEFSEDNAGHIISEKLDETRSKIEEITGMDFKRFSQAMLLEQGGFDAFLKANANERSQILELITGTEIYGEISTKIYERTFIEYGKLEKIKILLENKKAHDNFNSIEEIQDELAKNLSQKNLLEKNFENIKKSVEWLKVINKIKKELDDNESDIEIQKKRIEIFEHERKKLDAGLRAKDLLADFSILKSKREQFSSKKIRCEKYKNEISQNTDALEKIKNQQIPSLEENLKNLKRNVSKAPDVVCSEIKTFVDNYALHKKNAQSLESEKITLETAVQKSQSVLKNAEENYNISNSKHIEAVTKLSDMLNVRTSAILDETRRNLKPGVPCPVCGSIEHPSVKYDENHKNSGDIFHFDDELKILRDKENLARKNFDSASTKFSEAKAECKSLMTKLESLLKALAEKNDAAAMAKKTVSEALEPIGIFELTNTRDVMMRVKKWADEILNLEAKITNLKNNAITLETAIETNKKSLADEQADFDTLKTELENSEKDFKLKLLEKNFESEEKFENSILDSKTLAKFQTKEKEINDRMMELYAIKSDRTEKFEKEQSKKITSQTLDELEPLFRETERKIKESEKNIILLKKYIEDREKMQAERNELENKIKIQEKIYSDWDALNNLIGQKDGGKYRKFAQRVTLSMMINLANSQLQKMNNRYILISTPDNGELSLSVIDKEQAGEIRPTENLSGGERFIVSLALALGLSQISGSKARVDSLFLDEGFGSLDEEALNMALDALGEIRREGRMIGIISHVHALKERISAQINVIPESDGVSILKGPGCSRL